MERLASIRKKLFLILKYMGITRRRLKLNASFVDDFKFGNFHFACLETSIGAYFNVKLGKQDYAELKTVGDAVLLIRDKLKSR